MKEKTGEKFLRRLPRQECHYLEMNDEFGNNVYAVFEISSETNASTPSTHHSKYRRK